MINSLFNRTICKNIYNVKINRKIYHLTCNVYKNLLWIILNSLDVIRKCKLLYHIFQCIILLIVKGNITIVFNKSDHINQIFSHRHVCLSRYLRSPVKQQRSGFGLHCLKIRIEMCNDIVNITRFNCIIGSN